VGGGTSGAGGEASAGPRGPSGRIGWPCGRRGGCRRGLHEALLRSLSLPGGAFNEKRSKSKSSKVFLIFDDEKGKEVCEPFSLSVLKKDRQQMVINLDNLRMLNSQLIEEQI